MRSPLLSSRAAGWKNIQLEYHRLPAHETAELSLPHHVIEVSLHYGASEVKINGKTHRHVRPDNVAIYPAHHPLQVQSYAEAEFIAIALPPSALSPSDSVEIVPRLFGQDPLILNMALALKQALTEDAADSRFYAESMATALTAHIEHRYSVQKNTLKPTAGSLSSRQLQAVLDFIQAHLSQPISLAHLAALTHLSPHHFATLFKASTGVSPYRYVIDCRVERAKTLLSDPALTLVEVGHRVGFCSQSHFTKVFRDRTTLTPRAYRTSL